MGKEKVTQALSEEQLARQLAKAQEEVTGLADSTEADASMEGASESYDAKEIGEKIQSAKKVMALLAKMRPQASQATLFETQINTITHEDPRDSSSGASNRVPNVDEAFKAESVLAGEIPETIGRFQIEKLLGQGGFGLVFLAHDPELNRKVALKVPNFNTLMMDDARTRFTQESRVVASLSHPNIVPIFEVGNDGPISFIASEYIDGTDLARWVANRGVLKPSLAAQSALVIADAIQHAHGRDVIHRDLKPANVLLETSPGESEFDPSTIRVTDFGLAKMLSNKDESLTRTGRVVGTPAFSAPEQLQASDASCESANPESADVYSLGAILYFLLTGKAPFEAASIGEMIRSVQTVPAMTPKKFDSDIPADLSAICLKCLEKSPRDRYSNVYETGKDLQRFLDGEPVVARPIPFIQRTWRLCRRNPAVASLAIIATLAVVGGLIASMTSAKNERMAASEARRQYMESKKVIDQYYGQVSQDPMFLSAKYKDVKVRMLESAMSHYERFLKENTNDPELVVELIRTNYRIASSWQSAGELEKAGPRFEETLRLTEDALAIEPGSFDLKMLRAMSLSGLGKIDSARGQQEKAISRMLPAIEAFESLQVEAPTDQELAWYIVGAYQTMVQHHRQVGQSDQANEYSSKQQAMLDKIATQTDLDSRLRCHYAISLGDQSFIARDSGDSKQSLELLNRSIEILDDLIENEPNPVWFAEIAMGSYYRRSMQYFYLGDFENAARDADISLKLTESLSLGHNSPDFIGWHVNVMNLKSNVLNSKGKLDESAKMLKEALAKLRTLIRDYPDLDEPRITFCSMLLNKSSTDSEQMKLDDAQETLDELFQVLDSYRVQPAKPQNPMFELIRLNAMIGAGRVLDRQGEYVAAIAKFNEVEDTAITLLDSQPNNPRVKKIVEFIHANRANSFTRVGRHEEAIADRRAALTLNENDANTLAMIESSARAGQIDVAQTLLEEYHANNDSPPKMKMATIHAAIASEIAKKLQRIGPVEDDEPEVSELRRQLEARLESGLQTAEGFFLAAVDNGYFADKPYKFAWLETQSYLDKFFQRPNIKPIVEEQRRVWKNTQ